MEYNQAIIDRVLFEVDQYRYQHNGHKPTIIALGETEYREILKAKECGVHFNFSYKLAYELPFNFEERK